MYDHVLAIALKNEEEVAFYKNGHHQKGQPDDPLDSASEWMGGIACKACWDVIAASVDKVFPSNDTYVEQILNHEEAPCELHRLYRAKVDTPEREDREGGTGDAESCEGDLLAEATLNLYIQVLFLV
mmetsp:Transcript_114224/g.160250  ORF Transcript_114224/g.160250 Transcript_114224/m.160250 type:complete len:127 (+) Transcript_114224:266-646(+)